MPRQAGPEEAPREPRVGPTQSCRGRGLGRSSSSNDNECDDGQRNPYRVKAGRVQIAKRQVARRPRVDRRTSPQYCRDETPGESSPTRGALSAFGVGPVALLSPRRGSLRYFWQSPPNSGPRNQRIALARRAEGSPHEARAPRRYRTWFDRRSDACRWRPLKIQLALQKFMLGRRAPRARSSFFSSVRPTRPKQGRCFRGVLNKEPPAAPAVPTSLPTRNAFSCAESHRIRFIVQHSQLDPGSMARQRRAISCLRGVLRCIH